MDIQFQNKHLNQDKEEESINLETIDDILAVCPIALDRDNPDVIKVSNYYLPFSTGFEIECFKQEGYNEYNFTSIPNIIEVINDNSEQRYRIPSGIDGFICLYEICKQLRLNSYENPLSGIHYHIDCTDFYEDLSNDFINEIVEGLLIKLDSWNYKGTYNRRGFSGSNIGGQWVRKQLFFKTLEFRIGEMTFDYSLMFKRITHLQEIVKDLKIQSKLFKLNALDKSHLYKGDDVINILKSRIEKI